MIETRGLTKRYGPTLAVDDLSFTVRPGRVTGFLGPNGAGKSTTMRMVLGLDRPTSGHALIGGRPYEDLPHPLREVGALLDAKWVHPNRSARAHLRWLARSNRLPAARVDEVLDQVGLTAVADRRAGTFSLGMSQRLGIAGALLGDPGVLLFDEPVNGLDPEGIVWIRRFMRDLAAEGRSVLVSSHLLPEMALTATDLVVIGRGRLIAESSTAEFVDGTVTSTVRVRSPQLLELAEVLLRDGIDVQAEPGDEALVVAGTGIARIGELAAGAGVVLHELALQRASLEEAFMHITGHDVEYSAGAPAGDRTDSAVLAAAGR
jgi:ABC-2 type transport system ATP-binding protein